MAEFPNFSVHLFNVSNFQMESSARFPEIDPTDLLEMTENTERSRTLKHAQGPCGVLSEVKWESLRLDICLVHLFLDAILWLPNWTRPTASSNLAVLGIFLFQLFPNWTACNPVTYTNPAKKEDILELPRSGYSETPLPLPESLYGRKDARSLNDDVNKNFSARLFTNFPYPWCSAGALLALKLCYKKYSSLWRAPGR